MKRILKSPNPYKASIKRQKKQMSGNQIEGHFGYLLEAIFTEALDQVGNQGQATIVRDLYFGTRDILIGQALNPIFNKTFVQTVFIQFLGVDKYLAIEEIIKTTLIPNVILAWDDTILNEGSGPRLFLKLNASFFKNPFISNNKPGVNREL
jgi:hypothetical protein